VFTNGFIKATLSTAQLLSHLSENISKQQGIMRVKITANNRGLTQVQLFHEGRE